MIEGFDAVWVQYRRGLGVDSPMNVWKKTFTRWTVFDEMAFEWFIDYKELEGEGGKIGSTVTVKTPARFAKEKGDV